MRIVVPILLLLLAIAGWSFSRLSDARDFAESAAQDEGECRQALSRIQSLRRRPELAGARELAPTELTARIESAAGSAGCPPSSIIRIDPEPPRRVGDSPYLETPTQVLLRDVSLRQAISFMHRLAAEDARLRIGAVRLSAPPGEDASDRWQLECTLAYVIYSPRAETPLALQ